MARCPSCSQNAHDKTVLARDRSASRRARGWAGKNVARSKGSLGTPLMRGNEDWKPLAQVAGKARPVSLNTGEE
jgi:hypothetical protein